MELWKDISSFLHIAQICNPEEYALKLATFESNVTKFYECGRKSFLTKNSDGDDEFFYSHVLRFYLPRFAKQVFEEHNNTGLDVFTMQGYERRNIKESKNTLKRFTNNKGNLVYQNLR
jgi:hypothetical protein